jgi:hypothetical protein
LFVLEKLPWDWHVEELESEPHQNFYPDPQQNDAALQHWFNALLFLNSSVRKSASIILGWIWP